MYTAIFTCNTKERKIDWLYMILLLFSFNFVYIFIICFIYKDRKEEEIICDYFYSNK